MRPLFTHLCALFLLAVVTSCGGSVHIDRQLQDAIDIYPDYKEVSIPTNIAPLHFSIDTEQASKLSIKGAEQGEMWIDGKQGYFQIPASAWRKMLAQNAGSDLELTVCVQQEGQWCAYQPFHIHVATDPIDPYVVYRLIPPGYELWSQMGIYQRNLENFDESVIYDNSVAGQNCANCHSFQQGNPATFTFHTRAQYPGTLLFKDGKITKLNTKTAETMSALVYPHWHPSGRYMVFSVNSTNQAFHANHRNRIEVYDNASDVVVYDIEKQEVVSCPALKSDSAFETFPAFSADGRSIYFCTAPAVEEMPAQYRDTHYSLCRIGFDPEKGSFGSKVDTLYHAADTASISFPRESPDGKFLTFTLHSYGNFSIWHKEADLYNIDTASGELIPLAAANSDDVESYHSWSRNSRWMVFSSRRDDGLYTRLYICHIDERGQAHKPFMLPQKNPKKFYADLMYSYNIPELTTGKVNVSLRDIESVLKRSKGQDLRYRDGTQE